MKDKSTPETDRIAESLLYERTDKRDYELRQHARRLECERDAERALADLLADCLNNLWHHHSLTEASYDYINNALAAWKESRQDRNHP